MKRAMMAAVCIAFLAAMSIQAAALTVSPRNVTSGDTLNIFHDITDCPTCHVNVITYVRMPRGNYVPVAVTENISVDSSAYHYGASYAVPQGWSATDYAFVLDVKRTQLWEEYDYEERFSVIGSTINDYFDSKWKTSSSASGGWYGEGFDDSAWSSSEGPFTWNARWYDTGNADWRWDAADQDFYVRKTFTLKEMTAVELRSSSSSTKECYVNGQKTIGSEFEDITSLVKVGANTVACHAKAEKRQVSPTSDYECWYSYDDKYNSNGDMNCDKSPFNIKCENPQNCFVLDGASLDAAVIIHGERDVFWNDGGGWYVNEMPISSATEYQTVPKDTYGEFSNGEWHTHAYTWPMPFDNPTKLKRYFFADGTENRLLVHSADVSCLMNGTASALEANAHAYWNLKAVPNVTAGLNVLLCDAPAGFNVFDARLAEVLPINLTADNVLATAGEPFTLGIVADGHVNATIYAELYDNETLVDAAEQNIMLSGSVGMNITLDPKGLGPGEYAIVITAYDEEAGETYRAYTMLTLTAMPEQEEAAAPADSSGSSGSSGGSSGGVAGPAPFGASSAASQPPSSMASDMVQLSESLGFSGRLVQNFGALQQSMSAGYGIYLQALGASAGLEADLRNAEATELMRIEAEKQRKLFEELAKADSENYYDAAERLRELAKGSYSYDTKQELLKKADELDAKAVIIVEHLANLGAAPFPLDIEHLQAIIEEGSVTGGTVQYIKNNAERGQGAMEVWGETAYGLANLISYVATNPTGFVSGAANATAYAIANPGDVVNGMASGYYNHITEGGNKNVIEGRVMGEAAMIILPIGIIGDAGKVAEVEKNIVSKAQLAGKIEDYPLFNNIIKSLNEKGIRVEYDLQKLEQMSSSQAQEVKASYYWAEPTIFYDGSTRVGDFFHEIVHVYDHIKKGLSNDLSKADQIATELNAYRYELNNANIFKYNGDELKFIADKIKELMSASKER